MVGGDWAVVEMRSSPALRTVSGLIAGTVGSPGFSADKIVEVRAYLDSALAARLFEENPI